MAISAKGFSLAACEVVYEPTHHAKKSRTCVRTAMATELQDDTIRRGSVGASLSSVTSNTLIPKRLHEPLETSNTSVAPTTSPSPATEIISAYKASTSNGKEQKHHSVHRVFRRRRGSQPTRHVVLRAVGLKSFIKNKKQGTQNGEETRKVVVNNTRKKAWAKATVHLLPCAVTIFLIAFNTFSFVNGPDIATSSKYALQAASKLHVSILHRVSRY